MSNYKVIYPEATWNNYAELFSGIMTSIQLEVYKASATYMFGDVVDCGCGTAKLAPFLVDKIDIRSYTGIDFSPEMVEIAQRNLDFYAHPNFKVKCKKIEDIEGSYHSAVSIQSYYAWSDPVKNLQHIYDCLTPQGIFVLATPNLSLDLNRLAIDLEKELLGHPYLAAYKQYNLEIAANTEAVFIKMDALVDQVYGVGFKVIEVHQRVFRGGLNYLVLKK
jgi:SAM-dependent methyltransferase